MPGDIQTEEAFRNLYVAHYERLWRIAFAFLHSRDEADDAVQSMFVRIWTGRKTLSTQVRGELRSYLNGAIRNECLRILKHKRVVDKTIPGLASEAVGYFQQISTPDVSLEQDETQVRIDAAIAALPERRRIAVTLRWSENLSYREIGELLEISEEAAQMLVTRAKQDLQKALSGL